MITEEINKIKIRDYPKIVFFVMVLIFTVYGMFIARTLDGGIVPDEQAHFLFSKHYSTTIGIPPDTNETALTGWLIAHNPFLYYWINGRIINFVQLVFPTVNNWRLLVILRLVSLVFALGSIIFCYLTSKLLIRNKWYQLLPSFMLTNTLMFVFVAGGVNYDNLAVLFSMAGLYFFLRVFNRKKFGTDSLAWMVCISLGTLVKFTILPLALIIFIAWSIFTIKNRKLLILRPILDWKHLLLMGSLILLIGGNLAIYGYNLITYRWILPDCYDLYPAAQCDLSPYVIRVREKGLDHKLTPVESIYLGYPDPLEYVVHIWTPKMFDRTFGIAGHKDYYPSFITYFQLLLAWVALLAVRYWKKPTVEVISATAITIAYLLVLIIYNYDTELVYGFKNFGLSGRYIFPVIGLIYGLFGYTLDQVNNKFLLSFTLLGTLAIYLACGPIRFLVHYNTIFLTWFIH